MFKIYSRKIFGISAFPLDICNKFFVLKKDFSVKKSILISVIMSSNLVKSLFLFFSFEQFVSCALVPVQTKNIYHQ